MQGTHDIINYSSSVCPFESGKCGKEEKKNKNLNILRTKRAFEGLSFRGGGLIKKIADTSFKP